MDDQRFQLATLLRLEDRHEDLLRRLEELDRRVEEALAVWLARRETTSAER